jgi:hypothetical protein
MIFTMQDSHTISQLFISDESTSKPHLLELPMVQATVAVRIEHLERKLELALGD